MTFLVALDEIVKAQFRNEPARRAEWETFEAGNLLSILNKYCNRGEGPFDSRESVLWYAMAYMYSHYEAARGVMATLADGFGTEYHPGLVDFGCGPLTSALALSDLYRERANNALSMSYLGIDTSSEMRNLAREFAARADCFRQPPHSRFEFALNASRVANDQIARIVDTTSCVILSFNYILGQQLGNDDVKAFADVLCRIKAMVSDTPGWLLYTNAKGVRKQNLALLENYCQQNGVQLGLPAASSMDHPVRRPLLASNGLVTVSAGSNNLSYIAARIW